MSIFQQLKKSAKKTSKSSEDQSTCDLQNQTQNSPHKHGITYQVSFNIDEAGHQSFNIVFPRHVDKEQNAHIISNLIFQMTTETGEHFHRLAQTNNQKNDGVIELAFQMWQNLLNKTLYGGVARPPTQIFG